MCPTPFIGRSWFEIQFDICPDGSMHVRTKPTSAATAETFEPGVRYCERELNEILRRFNEDTARLRRALVEHGLMGRDGGGGAYWQT